MLENGSCPFTWTMSCVFIASAIIRLLFSSILAASCMICASNAVPPSLAYDKAVDFDLDFDLSDLRPRRLRAYSLTYRGPFMHAACLHIHFAMPFLCSIYRYQVAVAGSCMILQKTAEGTGPGQQSWVSQTDRLHEDRRLPSCRRGRKVTRENEYIDTPLV